MEELNNNSIKKLKPLKKFGQNYLHDQNILSKIAEVIHPQSEDTIVEIGPGKGALTSKLFDKANSYFAVEIDSRVIEDLKINFPNITVVNEDFLNIDLNKFYLNNKRFRVVGNIPYNITSPILFKLLESRSIVKDVVLLVQLEVAQRIVAKSGTKEYGILSVILNTFADVKLCFKVSPNVFCPRPKVYSAVIKLDFKEDEINFNESLFIKTVKATFNQRRKTLRNSLGNSIFAELINEDCPINLNLRAEQLTIKDFIDLTNYIEHKRDLLLIHEKQIPRDFPQLESY